MIVIAYADMTPEEALTHKPRVVLVDNENNPTQIIDLDGTPIMDPHDPGTTNAIDVTEAWPHLPSRRRSGSGRRR